MTIRLILRVTYNDNGVPVKTLQDMLDNMVYEAMSNGILTGETEATIEGWSSSSEVVGDEED